MADRHRRHHRELAIAWPCLSE